MPGSRPPRRRAPTPGPSRRTRSCDLGCRKNREKPVDRLIEEQRRGTYSRSPVTVEHRDHDFFSALATKRGEGGTFLLEERAIERNPLGEKRLGAVQDLRRLQ